MKFFTVTSTFILLVANAASADCTDFSGKYVQDMAGNDPAVILTITQTDCSRLDWSTDYGNGYVVDRPIVLDGQAHVTYNTANEVITEIFTTDGVQISYTSSDQLAWGELFYNKGTISKDANGNVTESYDQFQDDGTFLYHSDMPYLKQ